MEANLWNEPTALENLQSLYSDFHKDVYGFRPRGMSPEFWESEAALQAAIDDVERASVAIFAEEQEREQQAIQRFEARVAEVQAMGAGDRATALRWIMDGSDAGGDWEYLCYQNGLPYRYFADQA